MKLHPILALATLAVCAALPAQDEELPTSNNRQITVVPAPGRVTVDGDDADWDLSAGIWSYNNPTLVNRYSVWTHLMWDADGLYLLLRYTDQTPLRNATSGKDFHKSWQADAFQGRVVLDPDTPAEHQMHINIFHSSSENRPYMLVHHGGFRESPPYDGTGPLRKDLLEKYGDTMDAAGGKVAFKPWADGKGYNMEVFWPWRYLRLDGRPLKAGDSFIFGIEAMWGDASGATLEHRLVDCMKNDSVNRIFFFRARDGWGRAVLSAKGRLDLSEKQKTLQAARLRRFVNLDTAGSVPIDYELPSDREVTIAIDDAKGRRVRNLIGQYPRPKGAARDWWDGLDDAGNPVAPGAYTARLLDHEPLSLRFLNSVYNSATPPWSTARGSLVWGSNHGHPVTAATRGDVILLGFTGTEGTSGMLRVTAGGRILWADSTEVLDVTLDDKFAYAISRESWTRRVLVRRLNLETGALVLFDNPEKSIETVLPVDVKNAGDATIAFAAGMLYVAIPGEGLWRIHPATGAVTRLAGLAGLRAIDDHDDRLHALFDDGRVARLAADGGIQSVLFTAKASARPARLAADRKGARWAVSDPSTNQVFIFDPAGKLLRTIGKPYVAQNANRPAGKFIETDLVAPLGMAFDAQDRLWVAEASKTCCRVTTWTPDGALAQQFWGSTDYGAVFGYAFAGDSTRYIAYGLEFQLDPSPDILNRPTREKPLFFHPALADAARGLRGMVYRHQGRDYAAIILMAKLPGFTIAKRDAAGVFQPVVSVTYADPRSKTDESRAWTDKNENGVEDPGEVVTGGIKGANHYWSNAWVGPDLAILTTDQYIYRPAGFTPGGVPLYDFRNPARPKNPVENPRRGDNNNGRAGTYIMDKAGSISDGVNFATADGRSGSYPNPWGRHDAPAARRGLLIAPFRTNGVVENVPGAGSITAIGGDRGEWFLLTLDGLYISSLFQDSKGDVTLDETFIGQECFGGFIWRDEKGRVLLQTGHASFRILEVNGLETTRRRDIPLSINTAQIRDGMAIAARARQSAYSEPETLTVARVNRAPSNAPSPATPSGQSLIPGAATARVQEQGDPSRWFRVALARDGKNLAAVFQVGDTSPWLNGEGRFTHAFIGGDCVDLQLDIPGRGPVRILGAPILGQNTVVYWQQKAETPQNPLTYVVANNTANARRFDIVKRLPNARLHVEKAAAGYTATMTIPLADLGLSPDDTRPLKGIAGVIYSDASGANRTARLYWHDKTTGIVSDVPSESALNPAKWGTIKIDQ